MTTRTCDRCGSKASPWIPRKRIGEELLCAGCAKNAKTGELETPVDHHPYGQVLDHLRREHGFTPSHTLYEQVRQLSPEELNQFHDFEHRTPVPLGDALYHDHADEAENSMAPSGQTTAALNKQAHDSGDGATIFHCPFCGSGQVVARSDRTTECEHCYACFTVQVQPRFSAFPQTINGMPMQIPGMPGQVGGPPAAPGQDPMAGGVPPGGEGQDEGSPFGGDDGGDPEEEDEAEDGGSDNAPPFAKGAMFLKTASGATLSYDEYLRHLAIKYADNRGDVIERVRQERTSR